MNAIFYLNPHTKSEYCSFWVKYYSIVMSSYRYSYFRQFLGVVPVRGHAPKQLSSLSTQSFFPPYQYSLEPSEAWNLRAR